MRKVRAGVDMEMEVGTGEIEGSTDVKFLDLLCSRGINGCKR